MSVTDVTTRIEGLYCKQFGKEVLVTQLPFRTLDSIFDIDSEVQRKLDVRRRSEIRDFILKAVKENTFYFSPFVFSARGNIEKIDNEWEVKPGARLYILDGQHRTFAMASSIRYLQQEKELLEELGNDIKGVETIQRHIDRLKNFPIAMQIYLNLGREEERQLFTDINSERKEAHYGLIMRYDQRDAYNIITRNVAHALTCELDIEMERSRLSVQNASITSLTIMRRCLLAMFEGILTVKTGEPHYRNCKPDEVPVIAEAFFKSWLDLFPRKMEDRNRFVCGLTGPQVALAYTVYQLTQTEGLSYDQAIKQLKKISKTCSWQHDDPLFRDFYDPSSKRIKRHSSTTAIKKISSIFIKLINEADEGVVSR